MHWVGVIANFAIQWMAAAARAAKQGQAKGFATHYIPQHAQELLCSVLACAWAKYDGLLAGLVLLAAVVPGGHFARNSSWPP